MAAEEHPAGRVTTPATAEPQCATKRSAVLGWRRGNNQEKKAKGQPEIWGVYQPWTQQEAAKLLEDGARVPQWWCSVQELRLGHGPSRVNEARGLHRPPLPAAPHRQFLPRTVTRLQATLTGIPQYLLFLREIPLSSSLKKKKQALFCPREEFERKLQVCIIEADGEEQGTPWVFDPFNLSPHRSERDTRPRGRQCSLKVVPLPH